MAADIKLPTLETGVNWKLAYDTEHQGATGDITFEPISGNETSAEFRAHTRLGNISLEVTNLLPGDYDTAENVYRIFRTKQGAWFTINNTLKAVILDGVPDAIPTWQNNSPYALGSLNENMGTEFKFKTNVWSSTSSKEFTFPLKTTEKCFAMFEGQPLPPRQFPVYNENSSTQWDALATGGTIQTSHPIPIWGYPNKTIYFKSDAAGTLDIEVYVGGGWETYDSPSLTANELLTYNFPAEMQAPIARLVYTPTDTDTINLAEVYLS